MIIFVFYMVSDFIKIVFLNYCFYIDFIVISMRRSRVDDIVFLEEMCR